MTHFIILIQGRTGSSYIIEKLNFSPDVYASGEMFSGMRSKRRKNNISIENIIEKQKNMLNFFFKKKLNKNIVSSGFKTKFQDVLINKDDFKNYIEENKIKIIRTYRTNIIKQCLSMWNSMILHRNYKKWNITEDSEKLPPLYVNVQKFKRNVEGLKKNHDKLKFFIEDLNTDILHLEYEFLFLNEANNFLKIFEFIGSAEGKNYVNILPKMKKSTDNNLKIAIENYDELFDTFKDTEYEIFFNE